MSKYLSELRLGDKKILNKTSDIRVLSLGAGVQSSTLLMKIYNQEIKAVDVAIFADTGNEPQEVYDWLEFLTDKVKDKIKILIVKEDRNTGDISKDIMSSSGFFASIPVYTINKDRSKGMTLRTCTDRYKIQPINKKVRELLGVNNLRGKVVEMVMGISFDEIQRAKYPPNKWAIHCYPLVENKISRHDCLHYFDSLGFPTPPRSACIMCPFHNNEDWQRFKVEQPENFKFAVEFDEKLRTNKDSQFVKKLGTELFIHPSRTPLKDINFNLIKKKNYQGSLFDDECEGYCGI
tara:strand:+ start:45 stop:920 length:876 start_codon:yes stop_codon:yes gene_type:complete